MGLTLAAPGNLFVDALVGAGIHSRPAVIHQPDPAHPPALSSRNSSVLYKSIGRSRKPPSTTSSAPVV